MSAKLSLILAAVFAATAANAQDKRLSTSVETEVRATLSAVKQQTAPPISAGGVLVTNDSNTTVAGVLPLGATSSSLSPLSGSFVWGTSLGIDQAAGIKGVLAVSSDNAGFLAIYSSGGTTGTAISGNSGVRTFSGDLAEAFPSESAEPGSVMAIDPARPGGLRLASQAYDRRVAGVVSGARDYKPGITLRGLADIEGVTLTLSGTVYCLASDANGPIKAGDLLTTSAIPGHAQRASDLDRARGAILGKAMEDLSGSRGHILVLAGLQ